MLIGIFLQRSSGASLCQIYLKISLVWLYDSILTEIPMEDILIRYIEKRKKETEMLFEGN